MVVLDVLVKSLQEQSVDVHLGSCFAFDGVGLRLPKKLCGKSLLSQERQRSSTSTARTMVAHLDLLVRQDSAIVHALNNKGVEQETLRHDHCHRHVMLLEMDTRPKPKLVRREVVVSLFWQKIGKVWRISGLQS